MFKVGKKKPVQSVDAVRRSRAQGSRASRPVYSYYASREYSDREQSDDSPRGASEVRGAEHAPKRSARRRLSAVLYSVVLGLCAIKVLLLVPSAKVVVPDDAVGQLATETYVAKANELLQGSVLNRTKLTLNANGVALQLRQQFPELDHVVITAPVLGNKPVVHLSFLHPALVVESLRGFYTIDQNGYVLAHVSAPPGELPLVEEASQREVMPGKQYIARSTVAFTETVANQLKAANISVQRLRLPTDAPYELDAVLKDKPYILRFNLQADAMQQSGGAVAVLKQLDSTIPAQYVDLRVPGRAYYK